MITECKNCVKYRKVVTHIGFFPVLEDITEHCAEKSHQQLLNPMLKGIENMSTVITLDKVPHKQNCQAFIEFGEEDKTAIKFLGITVGKIDPRVSRNSEADF